MDVGILDGCPYCGEDLSDKRVRYHLPCDDVPTTDEVIEALEEKGIY